MPNMIWLYRRPILAYWADHPENSLTAIVAHVLVHEIGHHFGFSDADMADDRGGGRLSGRSGAECLRSAGLHLTEAALAPIVAPAVDRQKGPP